jgi:hypothetical protein
MSTPSSPMNGIEFLRAQLAGFLLRATSFLAFGALSLFSAIAVEAAQTAFYYASPPGDYIGGGRTRTFVVPADSITATGSQSLGISVNVNEGTSGSFNGEYWSIKLAPAIGGSLTVGAYEGAAREPFRGSSPGLEMYGTGRGCNQLSGRFSILEIAFAVDGTLEKLAANFRQQCETFMPALVGEIRINSAIPLTNAVTGTDTSPDPFALVMQSPADPGSSITSLTTTIYGINAPAAISIVDGEYKVNGGSYTNAPSAVANGDQVTVRTTARSVAGASISPVLTVGDQSATTTVKTYQQGTKLTGARLTSAPGDYIGGGAQRLYIAPLDRFSAGDGYSNSISVGMTGRGGQSFSFEVAPPLGATLALGAYENAKRFPFQDAAPGLSFSLNSSGCNQISGRFVVRELVRNLDGSIAQLAIDFEQYCENSLAPLIGEVRVNSSVAFTSLPNDVRYGVSIKKVGRGSGTVYGSGGEISCGFACTVYLPSGWSLSLLATPAQGSVFKGWEETFSPVCTGSPACNFQVTAGRVITARFEVPTKLTVTQTGTGSGTVFSNVGGVSNLNCTSTCSADFDLDTVVVLNANASYGSVFTGWSGASCSGESTCTVTMSAAKTVQANFVLGFVLSVSTDQLYGSGKVISSPAGIDCGTVCRAVVSPVMGVAPTVTLTAIPNAGSLFTGWNGNSCSGTAPCIVLMQQARDIKATFTTVPRRLSVSRTGTGDGVVTSTNGTIVCGNTCTANFSPAVGIELVAIPVQGSTFVGWSGGGCSGAGSCVVSQTNDVAVTAIFERIKSTLARTTDSNNDGKSDLLIQTASGTTTAWQMNGTSISSASNLLANQPDWTITHIADFNGDGKADILWRNVSGAVTLWLMDGSSVIGSVGLIGPDANWRVTDVADFNGDGKADILWRNTNGAVTLWLMNGTTITSTAGLLGADANWRVSHVGDFNGDGKADLLWRSTNGAVTIWLMNGTTIMSAVGILGADANWSVTHVADFNGDGKADLLWRNSNGAVTSWLMDGTAIAASAGLLGPNVNWSVTHTADFNGDSKADILWRNTNGAVTMWIMNGNAVASTAGLIGPDANWRVTHTADYDGDGKSDLLWRKIDGSLTVWVMNGTSATATDGISGATTTRVVP